MNNNVRYQQSIAAKFAAIKNQVKFFIADNHWGEDGRYKEIILMNFLREILPNNVGVGTGFVRSQDEQLTTQIDIIIYKKNDPRLFSEGDFVILMPESVLGIIEVKSTASSASLSSKRNNKLSTIEKCHRNGLIIGNNQIFNGIFSYDKTMSFGRRFNQSKIVEQLGNNGGYLNHICFDSDIFMRFWEHGNPQLNENPCYSLYDLSYENIFGDDENRNAGLAFGYFISNMLEMIYTIVAPEVLNTQYFEFLYPLENTKEIYRFEDKEIYLNK